MGGNARTTGSALDEGGGRRKKRLIVDGYIVSDADTRELFTHPLARLIYDPAYSIMGVPLF